MGPLPQTPTDLVVPMTLMPYVADQATVRSMGEVVVNHFQFLSDG